MPIIEVNNLTKEYQLGSITSLKQSVLNAFNKLTGRPIVERERFKALDDISFTIEEGEVVGIIGTNGAGKSTLLKHLAHITIPTHGEVIVTGSVAPLIEVGAGLNPELTGRENIFLNGAILGIPKKVIRQKLDEIVEFSELERFIDTPLKRYSSGMSVRLGFSIATSLEAEILIVDEVLAVGDLAFQRKCFDRMEELIKKQGKTVLIVSHNLRQIQRMCSRVILLDHGEIVADSASASVCNLFYEQNNQRILNNARNAIAGHGMVRTSGEASIDTIHVLDLKGAVNDKIHEGSPFAVNVEFSLHNPIEKPELIIGIHTTDFIYLVASSTILAPDRMDLSSGKHQAHCEFLKLSLVPGVYCIWFGIVDKSGRTVFAAENLTTFSITPSKSNTGLPARRLFESPSRWKINNTPLVTETSITNTP